jgi:hypothetical protein
MWLDACRDDLARAEQESDTRLRSYWANVGRVAQRPVVDKPRMGPPC